MINFELAQYAVDELKSRGRLYLENYDDAKYRSVFGRDRDRIINSSAFRRLQYKTQVFVNHEGDHYRTRLTHSLEVAQIARWIAGALKVNKDLAELVSLAHDLGHPPFGHAGEDVLSEKMLNFDGFSHNAHALKIVTKIETRFIDFVGLNLSWETLEGVVKHNGPIEKLKKGEQYLLKYNAIHDLDLKKFSSLEAQISAISDDIAYNNHDLEDGLRADLFSIEELFELPLVGEIYQKILAQYPKIKREMLVGEAKKQITLAMVLDVIENSKDLISDAQIQTQQDVRDANKTLISFSVEMEKNHQTLKQFLMKKMYRHPRVNQMTEDAKKIISGLFDFYFNDFRNLPNQYLQDFPEISSNKELLAEIVCDYIAGMTDRFAGKEFEKIFA